MLSRPTSYHLYCWAHSVVERCGINVSAELSTLQHSKSRGVGALRDNEPTTATTSSRPSTSTDPLLSPRSRLLSELSSPMSSPRAAAAATSPGGHQQQHRSMQLWVLAPILAAVPTPLRSALLTVNLAPAAHLTAAPPAHASPPSGLVLEVRALCRLSRGLLLSPLVLLPGMDCEDAMITYGPEALSWAHLLRKHGPQPPSHSPGASGGEHHPPAAPAPGTDPALPEAPGHQQQQGQLQRTTSSSSLHYNHHHHPLVLYELYICPSEEDKLCDRKLALLTACGLGCIHYLTHDLSTEVGMRLGHW